MSYCLLTSIDLISNDFLSVIICSDLLIQKPNLRSKLSGSIEHQIQNVNNYVEKLNQKSAAPVTED